MTQIKFGRTKEILLLCRNKQPIRGDTGQNYESNREQSIIPAYL